MAEKVAIAGQVEDVQPSTSSFRVGGRWFERAQRSEHKGLPSVGSVVRFDAYGQKQNLWYRFQEDGNGTSGAVASHSGANGGHVPTGPSNGTSDSVRVAPPHPRGAALMAAAMLLQGIDGTVESAAQSALVVAGIFEQYLGGAA